MQPLITVDHESRHNSNRAEDTREPLSSENTPLLHRYQYTPAPRSPLTNVIVSFLLIILIGGVIIGMYLLVLQNNSENVLPPVEIPLQLVSRTQWDHSNTSRIVLKSSRFRVKQIIVVQTGTEQCFSTDTCSALLQGMQANATATNGVLPYNFLISSNGQTYEALGWQRSLPIFIEYSQSALVLAFIGNFTQTSPTRAQLEESRNFFAESVSQQYLDPSYSIIGKNYKGKPTYLFKSLKQLFRWNKVLSDD